MTDETNKIVLGEKIKQQRLRLKMSQFELAERVGIHEKQIYRIESGKNSPSVDNIIKIIDALDMDIRILDYKNIRIFNPIKDEILSLVSDANDDELMLYRDLIKVSRNNLKKHKNN